MKDKKTYQLVARINAFVTLSMDMTAGSRIEAAQNFQAIGGTAYMGRIRDAMGAAGCEMAESAVDYHMALDEGETIGMDATFSKVIVEVREDGIVMDSFESDDLTKESTGFAVEVAVADATTSALEMAVKADPDVRVIALGDESNE